MKPSDNPPDALIASLHAQGLSIRAVARVVGQSRSRVHEIVTALTTADTDPDPWTDDGRCTGGRSGTQD
jgi:hypothetical protein